MRRTARGPRNQWLNSKASSDLLGITPRRLRALRPDLKLGFHYRIVSKRSAARPTYVWNVEAIEQFLGKPLEQR